MENTECHFCQSWRERDRDKERERERERESRDGFTLLTNSRLTRTGTNATDRPGWKNDISCLEECDGKCVSD